MAVQYNLINQDVFEGLKALESDSFDLCIVDPPYGASSKHNWDYGKKGKVAGFGGEWNLENEAWDLLSKNNSFLNFHSSGNHSLRLHNNRLHYGVHDDANHMQAPFL